MTSVNSSEMAFLRLSIPGAEYLGRHHKYSVAGCASLCGTQLRRGSSCLLHPYQGAELQ